MPMFVHVIYFFLLSIIVIVKLQRRKKLDDVLKSEESSFLSGVSYLCKLVIAFWKYPEESQLSILRKLQADGKTVVFSFLSIVLVSRAELINEIQNSTVWADRPSTSAFDTENGGRGIILGNGHSWRLLRYFSMKTISKLGLSKNGKMEDHLVLEMHQLFDKIDTLAQETGNRIQVINLFSFATMNIMWSVLTSRRFENEDSEYVTVRDALIERGELSLARIIAYENFRKIIDISPGIFGYGKHFEAVRLISDYFKAFVKERISTRKNEIQHYDFTECFLSQMDSMENNENEISKKVFNPEELVATLIDLVSAGMDTTRKLIESSMLFMCKYPEAQMAIKAEIDENVGNRMLPSYLEHSARMPYTIATLMEIRRMTNVLPFNSRAASEDYKLGGLHITKGTSAIMHMHAVNMDEHFWKDPYVFRPERFLDKENNFINEKVNRNMAFGGAVKLYWVYYGFVCKGIRRCPGQIMATISGFSILTALLQRYKITAADSSQLLKLKDEARTINTINPFLISITKHG